MAAEEKTAQLCIRNMRNDGKCKNTAVAMLQDLTMHPALLDTTSTPYLSWLGSRNLLCFCLSLPHLLSDKDSCVWNLLL